MNNGHRTLDIVSLTAATPGDISQIGGKGAGLVRMLRAGFPVPETWVLPAVMVPENEADVPTYLQAALAAFWESFQSAHPGKRLAVRSSATAEDLADASFAGVYTTCLNVDSALALVAAVQTCRRALHTEQARAYRHEKRFAEAPKLALLLQRMIDADTAGVLLTANPLQPFAEEMVIDASYGLGEAVVSGLTQPDHFVLHRATGTILQRHQGAKEIEIVYEPARGHVERPVDPARRAAYALTDAQIQLLGTLGRDVERAVGPRQDCEWAFEDGRLFVLQQRPMTGMPPGNPKTIWSRKFGDEYLADYTLPLGYTVLVPWITDTFMNEFAASFGFAHRLKHEPVRRYNGYAYVSGEYMTALLSAIPKQFRKPETMGWFTPMGNAPILDAPFRPQQLLRMAITAYQDKHSSVETNPAALEEHCRAVDRTIVPKLLQSYEALKTHEWRRQFDEAMQFGENHFLVIRWGMGFHNPLLHNMLRSSLHELVPNEGELLYQRLISGLPGTHTVDINRAVWELAEKARGTPTVSAHIQRGGGVAELREQPGARQFLIAFDAFLAAFGHRGASREIAQPRWSETPDVVLGFLRPHMSDPRPPHPEIAEHRTSRLRTEAHERILSVAGRGAWGPLRRRFYDGLIKRTQLYTRYRENQRFHLDYILYHVRKLVLAAADRLTDQGLLKARDDVFFLERAEFLRAVDAPRAAQGFAGLIEERRSHYLKWRNRLPATYLFDGVETEGEVPPPAVKPGENALHGTAASAGRSSGPARVVRTMAELNQVRPGDILIAPNTDPGWTSVFPLLAGLVTETGGILSHGALLAREYGIPAVTGVAGATSRIQTGAMVQVDGATGVVVLV